ncbi:MAG: arylsulfatase [Dehalococcoidales bacterium]|jgi:arylsulfatase A-like enzyme|nr:arylsulfatase [Dehalococcoidales bacterium]
MSNSRPNIIFFLVDQLRYDAIGSLGVDHGQTPHIDALVEDGVTFENCFVTAPSCAPSRASVFTGYYPHTTGIMKNGDPWERSWVERLGRSGYHCVSIGKMHTTPFDSPCGFDDRYVVENKDRYLEGRYFIDELDKALRAQGLIKQQRELYRKLGDYRERLGAFTWDLPEEYHPDNFVGNAAVSWINETANKTPLFMQIGFPGPHPPYDPTPNFLRRFDNVQLPLQEIHASDVAKQPSSLRKLMHHNTVVDHDSLVHIINPSVDQRMRQRRHYFANVAMIDHQLGKIVKALSGQGYLDNAIIVFASDHGDCLGDHGHSQKWTMYDQVTRVPLVVYGKRFKGGRQVKDLVQLMDIGPAIMEWAEVDYPDTLEAQSVRLAVEGRHEWVGRDYVYAEQVGDINFTDCTLMTMVRNSEWKLVHFLGETDTALFDLQSDPDEIDDLSTNQLYEERKKDLMDVLFNWRLHSQLHTRGYTNQRVNFSAESS